MFISFDPFSCFQKRLVGVLGRKQKRYIGLREWQCKATNDSKYACRNCEYQTLKWLGRCPRCQEWDSFDYVYQPSSLQKKYTRVDIPKGWRRSAESSKDTADLFSVDGVSQVLEQDSKSLEERLALTSEELSRVFGGGIIAGSVVLIGGDPGVGKSTLAVQIAAEILQHCQSKVIYVSGEESIPQLVGRIKRLNKIQSGELNVLSESDVDRIVDIVKAHSPVALIIDSIQTCSTEEIASGPGTVSQIRECAAKLTQLAKESNIATFLIGHVTKSGDIAGPKVLEHIVDTVLYLEGERYSRHRILRCVKNRFGSTSEIAVLEMTEYGLSQVLNPSQLFLSQHRNGVNDSADIGLEGSAVVATMEGTRAILVEVQGLAFRSAFSQPRRTANGFDLSRLYVLLAVLSKRLNYPFQTHDVYLNVVGGFRIQEPSADLAAALCLVSSLCEVRVRKDTVFLGEVGLCGELRTCWDLERRVFEAEKLGFRRFVCPSLGSQVKTGFSDIEDYVQSHV
ncbi:DNA repair protein RadA/Sms [Galdieria sulphuraria]|uniref:DNA repair protein RadA/Sms n=1 Tax=Galdieria sulphuraria TaxID=130081 RepID=M2X8J8_GALSU|nr:DNA repair protein RadA/Sms [Galdieria sulphuraria]EME32885.1 DNA repair protein RadA/Sms [Galdieria sulphuraria]|eukprot:XP_005709405.1 DNA repair protein RadA/Sms [Galdieria sulphuraria]